MNRFTVRLTNEERDALRGLTEKRGVSLRRVVGDAILDARGRQDATAHLQTLIDARLTAQREDIALLITAARDALIEQTRSDLQTVITALRPGVAVAVTGNRPVPMPGPNSFTRLPPTAKRI